MGCYLETRGYTGNVGPGDREHQCIRNSWNIAAIVLRGRHLPVGVKVKAIMIGEVTYTEVPFYIIARERNNGRYRREPGVVGMALNRKWSGEVH